MAYHTYGDSGSTLTPDERASEAARCLRKLEALDYADSTALTEKAKEFITSSLVTLVVNGRVDVTVAQLFYLRDSLTKL